MTDPISMDSIQKAARRISQSNGPWDAAYVREATYLKGLAIEVNRDLANGNLSQDNAGDLLLAARTLKQIAPETINASTQSAIDAKLNRANVRIATASDKIPDYQKPLTRGLNYVQSVPKFDDLIKDKTLTRQYVDNMHKAVDAFDKNPTYEEYQFLKPRIAVLLDNKPAFKSNFFTPLNRDGFNLDFDYLNEQFNRVSAEQGYEKASSLNKFLHTDLAIDSAASDVGDAVGGALNKILGGILDQPVILAAGGLLIFIALKR